MTATPLVAVDIGNSYAHLAYFDGAACGPTGLPHAQPIGPPHGARVIQLRELSGDAELAGLPAAPLHWFVASVHRGREQQLAQWIERHRAGDTYRRLDHQDFPLRIEVELPDRVGHDRLAAAVAANRLRAAGRAAIVVDAGTAITVDLVDAAGAFQGGAILPGLQMSARALAEQTDALPQVPVPRTPPPGLGKHTRAAIESGLFWGAVGGIRMLIERLSEQNAASVDVLLTGGDGEPPAFLAAIAGRFVPHLALYGTAITGQALLQRSGMSG